MDLWIWFFVVRCEVWQSPIGKQAVPHWASLLRWIWSISECNRWYIIALPAVINQLRPMKSAGQGMLTKPGSQGWVKQPIPVLGLVQTSVPDSSTKPLGLRPSGLVELSGTLVWTNPSQTSVLYSLNPSQAYIAKHVSYPQLTTTRGAPLHVYSIQFG